MYKNMKHFQVCGWYILSQVGNVKFFWKLLGGSSLFVSLHTKLRHALDMLIIAVAICVLALQFSNLSMLSCVGVCL